LTGRPRETGVRLIILYKTVKGCLGLAACCTLFVLLATHETAPLEALGGALRHHFAGAWSVALARLVLSAVEPKHLVLVATALGFDGVLTLVEGWALHHGHWWGPWLVVVATSSLLPFEIVALVRHLHLGRLIVFCVNVAIVAYLVRHALSRRKALR
jgi:uncharacterized membrane protein (DUF2068 family)